MLGLQRLFFGTLRPIEVEQLYEKGWFAITETCLAMTIFREEVGAYFLVMFVCLLIGKVWGWIGEGRVEILEQQPPANPRLFHLRLSCSLIISSLFDIYMLLYSVQTVLQQARPNMMVVFAFEFAVLHVTSLSTTARYTISLYEASVIKHQTKIKRDQIRQERAQARRQVAEADTTEATVGSHETTEDTDLENLDIDVPGWEEKGRWVFYLDLTTGEGFIVGCDFLNANRILDFFKLVLYLTFFCVLCMFYGMPIHIIRDVALTIRSFYKRIHDFVRYRQATKDMNERYPDATSEEIAREDVCIICREDMRAWRSGAQDADAPPRPPPTALDERTRPKKLPCGHILHFACLRSWLERQQNCPTCRRPVLVPGTTSTDATANAVHNNAGAGPHHNQQQPPNAGHMAGQQPAIAHNVFNLGPLRLAFGARIGGGMPPQMNNNPPAPNQQDPAANPQGIGNGFGLFRPPQQRTAAAFAPSNVPAQLQQIEQQIMREVNALRVQADQLYLVRSLQGELARLRIQQTQVNQPPASDIGPSVNQQRPPNPMPHPAQLAQLQNTAQVFTANQQQQYLGPGHSGLPPGMTLPEGWTVLPLQRVGHPNPAGHHITHHIPTPFSPTPTTGPVPPQGIMSVPNSSANLSSSTPAAPVSQLNGQTASSIPLEPIVNGHHTRSRRSSTGESNDSGRSEFCTTFTSGPLSQAPPSSTIPSWGSASASHDAERPEPISSPANGNVEPVNHANDDDEASTARRREAKGKGRAVTVEDLIDDVD